ncbi:MAG TPA: efflux RND transporter periplasmic adaptor subunit [Candidatus Hydrogenedentes bacterium]|nr:efflux RND transporter periplasmic adaptor subunit [Candidatus Hydrogenedentota bacterium]HQE83688.1 efflux RND transporter periplasmic adaptor subunit [Candidatus Hydrogenedentota bacterium]HQH53060.1 efflux RND transporter periplasmic adaptor subunit [Candidatus Hydrogenedentota bacterium]HQM48290.1 efflux RND transporter periplasmic adaptor subunit [Candidatus Hydrogenedentota bacterium]
MHKYLAILGLAAALAVTAGCSGSATGTAAASAAQAAAQFTVEEIVIPVEVKTPTRGDISAYFETTTRIEAENRVDVTAEGMGNCVAVFADEGDKVNEGDVLAELDKDEARAALNQAMVTESERKTACGRAKQAFEAGILAEQDRDAAQFAYDNAVATRRIQELQLANLTIRAPISGVVTHRHIQAGMLVSAGTPAFSLVDPSSYQLVISPPEKNLMQLREGQIAKFTVDAIAGEEFEARIARINPSVDPTSGTIKVVMSLDKATQERLREAAFARVRLVMETHESVLLVPKDAVIEENARTYVFLARSQEPGEASAEEARPAPAGDGLQEAGQDDPPENTDADNAANGQGSTSEPPNATSGQHWIAERVEVEVGLEDSDESEIVAGLSESDLVITLGQQTLKPGTRISITTAEKELAKSAGLSAEEALKAAEEAKINKESGQRGGHHGIDRLR